MTDYAPDWRETLLNRLVVEPDGSCTYYDFAELSYFDVYATVEMKASLYDQLRRMEYRDFLHTRYWRIVRAQVLHMRGLCCGMCGDTYVPVDVHHTSYRHHGEEHRFLDELHVRCQKCHKALHQPKPKPRNAMDSIIRDIARAKEMP